MNDEHSDKSTEFYLREYDALRKEILWMLQDSRSVERNAVIAVGATWVWLLTTGSRLDWWAWLIPILFAALSALRSWAIFENFRVHSDYIKKIEAEFSKANVNPGGWENFFWAKPSEAEQTEKRSNFISCSAIVFWATLLLATIGAAILPHPRASNPTNFVHLGFR
jgi:hypothetical protein